MGRVPIGSELRIRSGRERSSRKHHSLGDWECPPGANERRQAGGFISTGGARPSSLNGVSQPGRAVCVFHATPSHDRQAGRDGETRRSPGALYAGGRALSSPLTAANPLHQHLFYHSHVEPTRLPQNGKRAAMRLRVYSLSCFGGWDQLRREPTLDAVPVATYRPRVVTRRCASTSRR